MTIGASYTIRWNCVQDSIKRLASWRTASHVPHNFVVYRSLGMATITLKPGGDFIRDMTLIDWSELLEFSGIARNSNLLRIQSGAGCYAVFRGSNLAYGGIGPGGLKSGTVTTLKLASVGQVIFDATGLWVSGMALASAYAASNDAKVSQLLLSGHDLLRGTDLADTLAGYTGADTVYGFGGNDKIFGGLGNDKLYGGSGNDTLLGEFGNDLLFGGLGGDTLFGHQGADTLLGDAGNDALYGGDGNDLLNGGTGNDTLYTGNSNDTASGGLSNDVLYGEAGNDSMSGGDGQDSIFGGIGNDTISGGADNDRLYGEADNDLISGGAGDDWIAGGPGDDRLLGDTGNDVLYAEAGADHLQGGTGNDRLYGGEGNDALYGGTGIDSLYGGAGADVFVFVDRSDSIPKGRDYIDDFSSFQRDRIDLSAMDALITQSGNQDFTYIGRQTFSGEAGELRWVRTAAATFVQADLNGDAVADFALHIGKSIDLHLSDFLL
ncbi:calcium-binding protein [Paracoccus benzoatiresistens]|uniref:Calcium-binding protein n=1 Tax=Paracoccus benzoatiresistens TaxID=2997341 RepID=A0ABT4JBD4_9RHOB|nr:calcium-binding protein [Paracoccus sp. EF6]MCZ0964394.1 calcium-binding protein [Paracoccus sp. EF6]